MRRLIPACLIAAACVLPAACNKQHEPVSMRPIAERIAGARSLTLTAHQVFMKGEYRDVSWVIDSEAGKKEIAGRFPDRAVRTDMTAILAANDVTIAAFEADGKDEPSLTIKIVLGRAYITQDGKTELYKFPDSKLFDHLFYEVPPGKAEHQSAPARP
jgi:hypothetical protein